jgi:ribosomal protein S18 acetylase RimI-like enzyme
MPHGLTIRQYRPPDRGRVLELHETAMRDVGAFVEGAPEPDLDAITESYLDSGGEFLVGEADGQIRAMGAFRPVEGFTAEVLDDLPERKAELKRMRVDPAHQRQGYGQQLYEELERRARSAGYTAFVLDTTPTQTAARAFYEENGFKQVHREAVDWEEASLVLLFYQKSLE